MYTEEIFPCNEEDTYCSISTHGTPKQEYNKCEFTVYNVDIRGTFNIGFDKDFFYQITVAQSFDFIQFNVFVL